MKPGRPLSFAVSQQISAGSCYVFSIGVEAGSDVAAVALANQAGSGGTRVQGARAQQNKENYREYPNGLYFKVACYATVTGTTPVCEVTVAEAPGS